MMNRDAVMIAPLVLLLWKEHKTKAKGAAMRVSTKAKKACVAAVKAGSSATEAGTSAQEADTAYAWRHAREQSCRCSPPA
jgi:hypothetical protein